jgi:hypothetical protein
MNISRSIQSLVLSSALALFASSTRGGEKAKAAVDTAGYDLVIADGQLVNGPKGTVDATLGNVVNALLQMHPVANIVLSPGLSTVRVSDLKLRTSRLQEELEAIRVASGSKFDWTGPGSPAPNVASPSVIDPSTGLPTGGGDPNTGLFVLREPMPTPETHRMVEAFNLEPYLEWLRSKQEPKASPEERERQIQKSLSEIQLIVMETIDKLKQGQSSSADDAPSFQFHRGANLMIVIGTNEAVDVARRIVMALPRAQAPSGQANEQTMLRSKLLEQRMVAEQELAQLRTQYTEDHPRVKELQARLEMLKQQLSQLSGGPSLRP